MTIIKEKKPSLLIMQLRYDHNSPRDIRTTNLLPYLKDKYTITIIAMEYPFKRKKIEGVRVIRIPYSFFSRYIFNKTESGYRPKGILKFLSRGLSYVGNKLFGFPDPWIWEIKKIKKVIQKNLDPPDLIICSILPFSSGEIIRQLCAKPKWKKAKVILDIGDPLAHNSTAITISKKAMDYEHKILDFANTIIITNSPTAKHYSKTYKIQEKKLEVIPQGVDTNLFKPKKSVQKINQRIKLIYAGAFYKNLRDPSVFLNTIAKNKYDHIEVNLFSEISIYGNFSHSQNIIVRERINHAKLVQEYQNADILIMFDNAYGMQTSGKIYELLSFEKPILFIYSNEKSSLYQEVKDYENVIVCHNSEKEIQEFFRNINMEKLNTQQSSYNREDFSWKNRADHFIEITSSLLE